MTMKRIQRALLDARTPCKIYFLDPCLAFRCRWRDRKTVREIMEAHRPIGVEFYLHWFPLMPWECRSLLKVISYMD